MRNAVLTEVATTDTARTTAGYKKTGDLITLPYTSTSFITQPYATRVENVQTYLIHEWVGKITLDPASDEWFETETVPAIIINVEGNFNTILNGLKNVIDPDLKKDLVTLKMIKNLEIKDQLIKFDIELTTPACPLKEKIQIDGGRACRLAPRTVHQWFQAPNISERHPATITYSKLSSNGFLGPELHRFYCSDFMKPTGAHLYWNPYCNGLGVLGNAYTDVYFFILYYKCIF